MPDLGTIMPSLGMRSKQTCRPHRHVTSNMSMKSQIIDIFANGILTDEPAVLAMLPSKDQRIVTPSTAVFVPPPCCVKRGRMLTFCGRSVKRLSVLRCAQTSASPGDNDVTAAS